MEPLVDSRTSVSPLTGRAYPLPQAVSGDRQSVDDFVALHPRKPVVVVQGLGFVGAVMALVCANALTEEYAVIGIDLPAVPTYWKICSINEGIFPVVAADQKVESFCTSRLTSTMMTSALE
jgi:UDP-N-acetyl-D-mannosaminuronate dehydrogenase